MEISRRRLITAAAVLPFGIATAGILGATPASAQNSASAGRTCWTGPATG